MSHPANSRLILDVNDFHPITAKQLAGAGLAALIAKATEGATYTASTFAQHRHAAKVAGIPFGSYLYLDVGSNGDEHAHYLDVARPAKGDLQPIVDVEDLTHGVAPLAHRAAACVEALEHAGYRPIVYGSASTVVSMCTLQPQLAKLPWWEAQYPGRYSSWSPALARRRMRLGHHLSVVMWQWTDALRLGHSTYDASRLFVPVEQLLIR